MIITSLGRNIEFSSCRYATNSSGSLTTMPRGVDRGCKDLMCHCSKKSYNTLLLFIEFFLNRGYQDSKSIGSSSWGCMGHSTSLSCIINRHSGLNYTSKRNIYTKVIKNDLYFFSFLFYIRFLRWEHFKSNINIPYGSSFSSVSTNFFLLLLLYF